MLFSKWISFLLNSAVLGLLANSSSFFVKYSRCKNFSGLELREIYDFGDSYANTLNEWNKKFQNTWHLIAKQGFPNKFKRMWEYYFAYCEVGFTTKTTNVSHFLLKLWK